MLFVHDWLTETAASADAYLIRIDLEKRRLQYKDTVIIDGGKMIAASVVMTDGVAVAFDGIMEPCDDPYMEVEKLYAQFKRSVPGKQERLNKGAFKAYSSDALSYEELENNMPRLTARILLEGFIVLAACVGLLRWHNPKHFYWQGSDPDLILYRNWII